MNKKSVYFTYLFSVACLLSCMFSITTIAAESCSYWGMEPQEDGFKEKLLIGTPNEKWDGWFGDNLDPIYDEPGVSIPKTWAELDEGSSFGVIFNNPATLCGVRFYSYADSDGWNHITSYYVLGQRQEGGDWEIIVPERSASYPKGLSGWETASFAKGTYYGIQVVPTAVYFCCAPRIGEIQFKTYPLNAAICNKYDTVSITPSTNAISLINSSINKYVVQNNIWNGDDGSQCLRVNKAMGSFSITSANHNKPFDGPPAAYPSIFKGCHWGNCTNNSGMPIKVSSILNANSSWSTVQPASGVYNVVYDLWLNQTPTTSGQPDGAELVIWLNHKGSIQPVGALIAQAVSIAGTKWDVWSGTNNNINVVSYVRNVGVTSVSNLNLKAFLIDAKKRHYIQPYWYLIAVEAGFEIWKDGAGLASSAFNVFVE